MKDHVLSTDDFHEDAIEQRHASLFNNQLLVCEDKNKICYYPKEKLREYIEI